ncbi:MAG: hypothetical protein JW947_08360 [Sedimentisphaerales bacterium]|nr:hypothetical protein [Sedimentisphaerales bacterium]
MRIEIKDKGKTTAAITAVKISVENGIAEYEIAKEIYAMSRVSAVRKYGTFKTFAETKGEELKQAVIDFVDEG